MEIWTQDDFEILHQCPWDNAPAEAAEFLYQDDMGCDIVRCPQCGIVYAKRRLNESGLPKYWGETICRVFMCMIRMLWISETRCIKLTMSFLVNLFRLERYWMLDVEMDLL